jgi:plastocyanin
VNVRRFVSAVVLVAAGVMSACGGDDAAGGPGLINSEIAGSATYEYTIPAGAGEALDAGTPLEILPAELKTVVGETIQIVNEDTRGHNVGPWFIGAGETLNQTFASAGEFEGVCTVHPSGQLVLIVQAA